MDLAEAVTDRGITDRAQPHGLTRNFSIAEALAYDQMPFEIRGDNIHIEHVASHRSSCHSPN